MTKKIFFLILFLGMGASIFAKDIRFSPYENRNLQLFPSFSKEKLVSATFTKEMDTYLSDQFAGRDQWIRFKTLIDKHIFQKRSMNGVYLGNDGSLLNRYTAKDFSTDILSKNIAFVNDFVQKYDASVILVPTASEILVDALPSSYYHINQQLLLTGVSSDFSANSILKEHQNEPIYFHSDHHWTLLGAYYIYKEFVEDPLPYRADIVSNSFYGTTFRKINLKVEPDCLESFQSPYSFQVTYDDTKTSNTLYNEAALTTMDQYSYYLDGNHAITHIINETLQEDSSLLIIKDSFANSFSTLVANNYKNVYLIDLRYYNGSIENYIEENNITEVLFLYNNMNFMQDRNLGKLLL